MLTSSEAGTGLGSDSAGHRVAIDWDRREPVSYTIQDALSEVENCSPTELDPLADYVDPDALEAFFVGTPAELTERTVSFTYDDYTVAVEGSGQVVVVVD